MSLMEVDQLKKSYGDKTAVKNVTFSLAEGRCVALLGPNGAGKTTTLNMLSGLLKPTSGEIRFQGLGKGEDLRKSIGYLPQYTSYYPWMSGREFLVYTGRLARLTRRDAEARADELLSLVGLGDAVNRRIGGYSGGMKQRLGLAQAMIHRPRLLILDEPVSALDPIGRRDVLELMKQLKEETTLLYSTHVLPDAEEVSDDILIIRQGELVISGSLTDIRKQHQLPMIIMELDDDSFLQRFVPEWKRQFEEVEHQGLTVKITMRDLEELHAAKQRLLKLLADHHAPVRKFEVAQTSLEDLFMKAVRE